MVVRATRYTALLLATLSCVGVVVVVEGLILPPTDKIKMGLLDELLEECEDESDDADAKFVWEYDVEEGYQLATSVFANLAACERDEDAMMWFPQFRNRGGEIDKLTELLNGCSNRLGGLRAECQHWPDVPASVIEVTWPDADALGDDVVYAPESPDEVVAAVGHTEQYVTETLCKVGLCPYTSSMTRAAVGLESVGVREGPVIVRHAADGHVPLSDSVTPATVIAAMYWAGVTEIIERPETEVATHLLVAPSVYDDDFGRFFRDCDEVIEPTIFLSPGSVGRVWFHPHYDLASVGGPKGGHAPPLEEVRGLMDEYVADHPAVDKPDDSDMAMAHDKTRWTPHATINLLRSKQLDAARRDEEEKGIQKRGMTFPRNIIKVLGGLDLFRVVSKK